MSSGVIRCHQVSSLTFPQDYRVSHAQRTDGPRLIAAQMDSPQRQFHSEPGGTPAIERNQRPSERSTARHALKLKPHQTPSKDITRHQTPSEAHPTIARTEVPLAATTEPNGMNDEPSPPSASASSWASSSTSA